MYIFYLFDLGPSNLTSDALKKHDSAQTVLKINKQSAPSMDTDSEMMDNESMVSSFKTMQSFASDWSGCSNMSYARFLNVFRSDSALHKEMLAILSAITEVNNKHITYNCSTRFYSKHLQYLVC